MTPNSLKNCSCSYLYALNTKEAREVIMERWGRMPINGTEARECKCCKNT